MNEKVRNTSIAAAAALLAACGGDGFGDSIVTPPPVVATNAAPTVATPIPDQLGQVGYAFDFDTGQSGTTFSDADNDALEIAVTFSPDVGLSASDGVISGTPSAPGDVTVTVRAADSSGDSTSDEFILSVGIDQDSVARTFGTTLDLAALDNYANQTVPDYIGAPLVNDNPVTDKGATLGRGLFYDFNLSIDNSVRCATCHIQAQGFSEQFVVSPGVGGGVTRRSSMRLINGGFGHDGPGGGASTLFWDQRASDHADQATKPIQDMNEHGFSGENGAPDFDDLIEKLEALDYYEELFRFVFLDPEITEERIGLALAQFGKSIQSFDSRYDEGLAAAGDINADFPNFTAEENRGKNHFRGQGTGLNCAACHQPPEFTIQTGANRGHNGVVGEANDMLAFDFTNTRSPSLRDIVRGDTAPNGPMMHDGSLPTLRDVMDHYSNIPTPGGEPTRTDFLATLDPRLRDGNQARQFNLTDAEKDALVAFMRTLSGTSVYTDPKWSDPF